jgi:SAM-dependent methyltransferase
MRIEDQVARYYSLKVEQYGATSQGVDWNGEDSQYQRFYHLSKVFLDVEDAIASFSLIDFGCGYGAYLDFLKSIPHNIAYIGIDISEPMLKHAKEKYPAHEFGDDINAYDAADYTIASGVFNVRQKVGDAEWLSYIHDTLHQMNALSKKGFSFNVLTSFSDEEFKRDYLYYADPMALFEYCKTYFSKDVALLHDYQLYEFTIIVRK